MKDKSYKRVLGILSISYGAFATVGILCGIKLWGFALGAGVFGYLASKVSD